MEDEIDSFLAVLIVDLYKREDLSVFRSIE